MERGRKEGRKEERKKAKEGRKKKAKELSNNLKKKTDIKHMPSKMLEIKCVEITVEQRKA